MSGESIFRVKLLPDGRLEYEDCRGNVSTCSAAEIGGRITQVLKDPSLPPVEMLGAGGHNIAEAAARNLLPPQYQPLIRGLSPLMQLIQRLMAAGGNLGPNPRYQQSNPAPGPQQHQQRPPDPRGPTFRRGRRVA